MNFNTQTFTGAVIKDAASGLYTAYFDDICGVVTQGDSLDDVKRSLSKAVKAVLKSKARLDKTTFNDFELEGSSIKLRSLELISNSEKIEFAL